MGEKDQHIKGGEQMLRDADFIISIQRNHDVKNPRIKIIRSKFTPTSDKEK